MRKILYVVVSLVAIGMTIWSCDDYEDYSELRDYELSAVSRFVDNPSFGEIMGKKINVISEKEFLKDTITDVSKNEFVLLENGVYMQIVRRGCGSVLKNGEKAAVLCRYKEYNINERNDSAVLVSFNDDPVKYQSLYDKIDVVNNSGTFKKSWSLTEESDASPSKTPHSMFRTVEGISMRSSVIQELKAPVPILSSPSWKVADLRALQK